MQLLGIPLTIAAIQSGETNGVLCRKAMFDAFKQGLISFNDWKQSMGSGAYFSGLGRLLCGILLHGFLQSPDNGYTHVRYI